MGRERAKVSVEEGGRYVVEKCRGVQRFARVWGVESRGNCVAVGEEGW
jgi:hypothetical protein